MGGVCGRYVVTKAVTDLLPDLLGGMGPLPDDYNVAPTALVPVDLNALLYGLERAIAAGCARRGDRGCAADFDRQASTRAAALGLKLSLATTSSTRRRVSSATCGSPLTAREAVLMLTPARAATSTRVAGGAGASRGRMRPSCQRRRSARITGCSPSSSAPSPSSATGAC